METMNKLKQIQHFVNQQLLCLYYYTDIKKIRDLYISRRITFHLNIVLTAVSGYQNSHCHANCLTNIIECRNDLKQSTFVAFIYFSKTYDREGPKRVFWLAERGLGLNMTTECSFKNKMYATDKPSKLGA